MKIYLNEMVFYGYHGLHPEERILGQRFIVNLVIETAGVEDSEIHHIQDTVDYTLIYSEVKHTMEKKQFHLLENCANEILDTLLTNFDKIVSATVRIKKPSVPINGSLASVEIEMSRSR
ncbi:MAG: dihydroneopterin aldolase [Candidatus Cloacimonas sp.]|nr:dihydroneopterin aldolase [Candidatus Cloacimonadota bacterium]